MAKMTEEQKRAYEKQIEQMENAVTRANEALEDLKQTIKKGKNQNGK